MMTVGQWGWMVLIAGSVAAGSRLRLDPGPDWLNVNGNDWQKMEPKTRLAYIDGFLAGAALGQAAQRARDAAAVRTELDALRRSGGLRRLVIQCDDECVATGSSRCGTN